MTSSPQLLHIFALIQDDVMDESASCRGQPSVHTLAAQLHLHSAAGAAPDGWRDR